MRLRLPLLALVGLSTSCTPLPALSQQIFSLSALQWTLRNANGSIAVPGALPSQAHLDLFRAGVIGDPLVGVNEYTQRWVVDDNWTYTADLAPFMHTRTQLEGADEKTLLVFYGIDTVANITFAGRPVAWVNNQFRRYVYDVSELLRSPGGDRNLTIALESAWHYGLNVSQRPDAKYFENARTDNYEYPGVRQWIRKISSDFGWDWGPAFVPSGIYKPAYLVTLSPSPPQPGTPAPPAPPPGSPPSSHSIFLDETSIDIYKRGQTPSAAPDQSADWIVNVTFGVRSAAAYPRPFASLAIPELGLASGSLALGAIPAGVGEATYVSAVWAVPDGAPQRWYPHDLGAPRLYNLSVALDPGGGSEGVRQTIAVGFRTIQLVQTPYPAEEAAARGITPGDQWHFAVNGRAFYSKGTNLIPFDPFYPRIRPEAVRWVLESAVRSGQNMLRVWGGGIYQPSDAATAGGLYDFYAACDELGILVWSELIFSDSLYPTNDFLLASVEPEVRENVRRINRHPSNAQWAGGNEIEGMAMSVGTWGDGRRFLDEFVHLFQDYLYGIVSSETKSVPYTDCSTTNGVLSLDPYVLRLGNGTSGHIYGNAERFNYQASQAFDYDSYPVARFVNEFGYHSMPSFYSWEEVLESPEDFAFNSRAVMSRDHHPPAGDLTWPNPNAAEGQYQMSSAVELWLPTPSTPDANHTFSQWCWSTQVFQAMAMASQIAWYRRGAGMGENNLGSLVWQLNDIWQGVSWSAIEYSGRWKVLQYALAGVYAPVIISAFWVPEMETLTVLATSDRWETVSGTAQLTWYDWRGNTLNSSTTSFAIPTLNNSLVFEGTGLDNILPSGYKAPDVWLLMNLTAKTGGRTVRNEQYFTPASLANATLVDPKIAVAIRDNYTFTLSAKGGVAAWAWLDHPFGTVGHFVDPATGAPTNGFYLIPGIDRTVQFIMNPALSAVRSPDPSSFVVRSLWNNKNVSPQTFSYVPSTRARPRRNSLWIWWLRLIHKFSAIILSFQT
ncbi:glycoside hydrolase family 2 protein [Leucogyrophana mollusca]|uniref:Glycoside hydrolase family 2 protein n=1 Tax=Leucogyrophana mollusca TaxID=85980 RepID=A0ACB8BIH2_9AGAM|nr:glycoside hydrolase family 2 protein [Leucogyrophana mollusca]